jgi:hypothetical protein
MDDFFDHEQKPPVAVLAKKRKRAEPKEKNEELEQLKQEARVLATCPEQWKTLSRYNHEKLQEWVLNERFRRDQLLYDTVYSFIQKSLAFLIDKASGGDGYVSEQILADVTLGECIKNEAANFARFLTNRTKLATLLVVDTLNGKLEQRKNMPVEEVFIEEINEQRSDGSHNEAAELLPAADGDDAPAAEEDSEMAAESAGDHQ